ncbi:Retrovirus-related Pol polyprotein from type-1 retrotransposable element R2 [Portunus trituberculatus]|uniref:Retrovirus-related Pol polyprotein from type-1 retrotransposable element R2 n=1 Tax=Portunus trituberculatus TaxID=210409 RepID=A0A5B7HP01_PORTR|nr:Retrovirus-related Pol polyprotein from type-1 retrotransposable element R2 [Portunus trituberculatus]
MVVPASRCPVCLCDFASFQGRRVHERRAHPERFHSAEAESLSARSRKPRWDQEELALMAAFEADNSGAKFMNKLIQEHVLPHRSIDSIKGARRPESYKALVRQHQTRLQGAASGIEEVEAQVDLWCPPRAYAYRLPGEGALVRSNNVRAKRRRDFRRIQRMWRQDRGRAVREIIVGIQDGPSINPPGLKTFWAGLFGRNSRNFLPESRSPTAIRPTLRVTGPITDDELVRAVNTTKPSTAPGPDGRGMSDIKALGTSRLGWVVNSCLLLRDVPQSWAKGRTTLISKKPQATEPGDFRPITITSILLRLFHKVLAGRLMAAAPLPQQQKGFAPEEGVVANILLIQEIINSATSNKTNLCVAFLDFKKTFDSVSHPSLVAATRRWGFPPELTEYIRTLYGKACTDIMGDTIRRRVLQGDPLSSYLFNITLDWALS